MMHILQVFAFNFILSIGFVSNTEIEKQLQMDPRKVEHWPLRLLCTAGFDSRRTLVGYNRFRILK